MKAIGLARVSTQDQGEDGISLDAQEAKIRAYCHLYGVELVEFFRDIGSGKDLDREGMQEALRMLRDGEAEGIVVVNLNRLTRSIRDLQFLIETYFSTEAGFTLCSVEQQFDSSSASGRMTINILMSVFQYEREIIGERTKDALRFKKSRGERTGSVPFGKDLAEDGRTLLDNPYEQGWLAQMRAWRTEGIGYTSIATRLGRAGVPTKKAGQIRNGKPVSGQWSPGTVRQLAP